MPEWKGPLLPNRLIIKRGYIRVFERAVVEALKPVVNCVQVCRAVRKWA
jgi:hypothetical protein